LGSTKSFKPYFCLSRLFLNLCVLSTELPLDYTARIYLYKKQCSTTRQQELLFIKSVSFHLQLYPFPQNIYCYRISYFRTAAVVVWSSYDSAAHIQFLGQFRWT